ncbi:hypothetical protein GCM10022381_07520 [Leifsonia kafniensis]|uniref:Secreted protein n=1 Tax=Leifsonia kafniensis TaxID=475957 RepID=A0ABP7K6W0_9MICO
MILAVFALKVVFLGRISVEWDGTRREGGLAPSLLAPELSGFSAAPRVGALERVAQVDAARVGCRHARWRPPAQRHPTRATTFRASRLWTEY